MRKRRFTKTHPQAILAQHDAGARVADLSREHQISAATFYKWKKGQDDDGQKKRAAWPHLNGRMLLHRGTPTPRFA